MKLNRILVLSIFIIILSGSVHLSLLNSGNDGNGAFSGIEEFTPNKMINEFITEIAGSPSIAFEDGSIYLVWHNKSGSIQYISFSKSMNNGTTFSPNIIVDPIQNANQKTPDIAVFGKNVYVVWEDFRNGASDIFLSRSFDGGNTFEPAVRVNNDPAGTKDRMPSVAVDRNSGAIYVAWVYGEGWDIGMGTHPEIHLASSYDNGSSFQQVKVSDSDLYDRFNPDVAVDGNGKVYVAWSDGMRGPIPGMIPTDYDFDVCIANSTDNGASFGANTILNDVVLNKRQRNPSITVDSNDKVHAVWVDERFEVGKYDIMYASSIDGSTFGENVLVNNSSPSKPSTLITSHTGPKISVDPSGDTIHAVWLSNRGGDNNVYIAKSVDGGQSFGPASSKFGGSHFFDDTQNGVYDAGEAVILDDGNDILDPGVLNGTGSPDRIMLNGTADLVHGAQGMELQYHDWNSNAIWDSTESIILENSSGLPSEYDNNDTVIYNSSFPVQYGDPLRNFSLSDRVVYMDSDANDLYTLGEPVIKLSHDLLVLTENDEVLQPYNIGKWKTFYCPFPLNDDMASGAQSNPTLATDRRGNVYAAWEDFRTFPSDIYYTDNVDDHWPPDVTEIDASAFYIEITFSEPVNISSFESSYSISPAWTGSWSWDPYAYKARFQPTIQALPSVRYDIVITTGLEDLSGNHMDADFLHSFVTPALPVIIHDAVQYTEVKNPIPLSARIIDLDGIDSAVVLHKTASEPNYTASNMSLSSSTAVNGFWTFTIPPPTNLSAVQYYIVATDTVGDTSRTPFSGICSVKVVDVNPPVIQHAEVTKARIGSDIRLTASVADDLEVASVLLYIRPIGATYFNPPLLMTGVQGEYSVSVNVGNTVGTLEYYIRAVDSYGNEALSPSGGKWAPHEIELYADSFDIVIFGFQATAIIMMVVNYSGNRKKREYET
jgi:hypothetical protein